MKSALFCPCLHQNLPSDTKACCSESFIARYNSHTVYEPLQHTAVIINNNSIATFLRAIKMQR